MARFYLVDGSGNKYIIDVEDRRLSMFKERRTYLGND